MNLIENYEAAKQAIYDHVGFVEDWVFYPIDDCTSHVWSVEGDEVKYADSIEQYNSNGDFYTAEIHRQRFYSKWLYRGDDFTMIFLNPGVDGMKYFAIFDNLKQIIL